MTGPGFNPPDTEKLLAFNVRVNELLGRAASTNELRHVKLCYLNKWTPEDTAAVVARLATMEPAELSTLAGEKSSPYADEAGSPQPSTIPST